MHLYRVAVAGYCKIFKVTTDDVANATKFKEAPLIDTENIVSDKQTIRDRENQLKNITIPVEVSHGVFQVTKSKQNKRPNVSLIFYIR